MKSKQLLTLLIIIAIAAGFSTCEIGVTDDVRIVLNNEVVIHHSATTIKTLHFPVGKPHFYEGGVNERSLGGGTTIFDPPLDAGEKPIPRIDSLDVYTHAHDILIPLSTNTAAWIGHLRGNELVYGDNINTRTGNDISAQLYLTKVSNHAVLVLCSEVLILASNEVTYEAVLLWEGTSSESYGGDEPYTFWLDVKINTNTQTIRNHRPEMTVRRYYKTGDAVEYGLRPRQLGGSWYINSFGLETWLPCNIHVEFGEGKPAPITGRPAHIRNTGNPDATSGRIEYFVYLTVLSTHEPVPASTLPSPDGVNMGNMNNQSREFYSSARAKQIADSLLFHQRASGGWHKNHDMVNGTTFLELDNWYDAEYFRSNNGYSTMDNDATHVQLQYLARIITMGKPEPKYLSSFYRGMAFVLRSQYDSGGWPQFADPLRTGYYSEITYNDDAMGSILHLLEDVYQREWHMTFVAEDVFKAVVNAREKALECVLRSQWRTTGWPDAGIPGGELTIWSQQVSPRTLKPSEGRAYERPSLGPMDATSVMLWLFRIPNPGPRVLRATQAAADWYMTRGMFGYTSYRKYSQHMLQGNTRVLEYTGNYNDAAWNRFYDLETGSEGLYVTRDGLVRWHFLEMPQANRMGYQFVTVAPAPVVPGYDAWKKRAPDFRFPVDDGLPELTWSGMDPNMDRRCYGPCSHSGCQPFK